MKIDGFKKFLNKKTRTIEDIAKKHDVAVGDVTKQLYKGIEVEKEHTSKEEIAKEIALDHLWEDPHYYDKLAKVEDK